MESLLILPTNSNVGHAQYDTQNISLGSFSAFHKNCYDYQALETHWGPLLSSSARNIP